MEHFRLQKVPAIFFGPESVPFGDAYSSEENALSHHPYLYKQYPTLYGPAEHHYIHGCTRITLRRQVVTHCNHYHTEHFPQLKNEAQSFL